jgi:hypothetical protein
MMGWGDSGVPQPEPGGGNIPRNGLKAALPQQFRTLIKALTGRGPVAVSPKRRKKTEALGGFRSAAAALFRRILRTPLWGVIDSHWETFTWLRIWDHNGPGDMHGYENSTSAEDHHSGLFPRL